MRKPFPGVLLCLLALTLLLVDPPERSAQAGTARVRVAEVNSLSGSFGLPADEAGRAPLAAAQAQRGWQAQAGDDGAGQIATPGAPQQRPAVPTTVRRRGPDYLLIAVLILGVAGAALVAVGSALKRTEP